MPPFITTLGRQLHDVWKKLGLNQRISVVLAAGVVLAGLGAVAVWSSRTDYALLYGRLDGTEAGKVTAALDDAKVPYRIGGGGDSIYVPAEKVHLMRMQLASKGIPKGDGVGFEIFDKPNFGISDFVQRANYTRALQGELARTISQLDEVDAARVMVVLPENRLLVGANKEATASVFIRLKGNATLAPEAVHSIRFLVANSIEGLQPNRVAVVDNRGTVLAENVEDSSFAGFTSNQLAARQKLEQYLVQKAQSMLEKVLGPGQAVVRVSVDLNTENVTRTEEKFDPKSQVIRISTVNTENTDTTTGNNNASAVAAGVATNTATETNQTATATNAVAAANNTHMHKTVENTQYEINKITSNVVNTAGGVTRVSAAVFVAAKTTGTGADRKMVPRTPEEIEKLRRLVQSALGLQVGEEAARKDEIALEEMPFNDWFATEANAQIEKTQKHDLWWDLGKNVGYGALVLAIMFMFWRLLRGTPSELVFTSPELATAGAAAAGGTNGGNGGNGGSIPAEESGVSVEALNKLLRENPNKMNQTVRLWLNESN